MRVQRCRATAAGVLCVMAGVGQLSLGVVVAVGALFGEQLVGMEWLVFVGIGLVVLGIMSIAGGVFAMKRRRWGLALTGSICALVAANIGLAIPAILLLSLAKDVFE